MAIVDLLRLETRLLENVNLACWCGGVVDQLLKLLDSSSTEHKRVKKRLEDTQSVLVVRPTEVVHKCEGDSYHLRSVSDDSSYALVQLVMEGHNRIDL